MLLLPNFRLPTLIHTRSANAKWLYEISHKNPVWMHPSDAQRLGVGTGDLVRVDHRDRLFCGHGVGHRRHQARRDRHEPPPGALAAAGEWASTRACRAWQSWTRTAASTA
jgi:anaerobic selenocysteine-containing dehydrogenase